MKNSKTVKQVKLIGEFTEDDIDLKETTKKPEPFVKWVGGKRNLLQDILQLIPKDFGTYYEPFIGGGALFFSLYDRIKKAVLSDNNIELVLAYKVIQKDPEKLIERLKEHAEKNSEKYFYEIRNQQLEDSIEIAARFIYLNKTCYNGLYRVNKKGQFNVPVGSNDNPNIVQEENMWACHKALKNATITFSDFELITPQRGDFVYFDPPYHPTSELSFTKYTKESFSEKDQERLRDFIVRLTRKKVNIMLSNSKTKFIEELYSGKSFFKMVVSAPRYVNCKPDGRGDVEELLITNYTIEVV